jgi:putative Mn2+ efflux pump MntP
MPLIGLGLGAPLGRAIGATADYVAIGVLLAFGLYAMTSDRDEASRLGQLGDVAGPGALLLGVSVGLDELAIGFTLGLLRLPAALVVILIAVQAFVVAQLGLRFGSKLGEGVREDAERLAGLALTGLAVVLLGEKVIG